MPAPSPEIANRFIDLASRRRQSLTHMQLQKLVYIAHGWNLALNNRPLTEDDPEAWNYGPVYRDLYLALRRYGSRPIDSLIARDDWSRVPSSAEEEEALGRLSPDEQAVLEKVFDVYGGFEAFQLSALTHQPNTPWDKVFNQSGHRNGNIRPDLIREHFVGLAQRQTHAK